MEMQNHKHIIAEKITLNSNGKQAFISQGLENTQLNIVLQLFTTPDVLQEVLGTAPEEGIQHRFIPDS